MKTSASILFIALMASSCHNDSIKPLMAIEAQIGAPFIISPPAEITLKESGRKLYIESISGYHDFGDHPPTVEAIVRYNDKRISLHHNLQCDHLNCEGYTYNANTFREEAKLNDMFVLRFSKVSASTVVNEYEPSGKEYRVDSAQFVVKNKD